MLSESRSQTETGTDDRADRDVRGRENGATRERDEARVTYTDEDSPRERSQHGATGGQKKLRASKSHAGKGFPRGDRTEALQGSRPASRRRVTVARHRIAAFRPATR